MIRRNHTERCPNTSHFSCKEKSRKETKGSMSAGANVKYTVSRTLQCNVGQEHVFQRWHLVDDYISERNGLFLVVVNTAGKSISPQAMPRILQKARLFS